VCLCLNNSLYRKVQKARDADNPVDNKVVEDAVFDGAVLRLRPKLMTVIVDILGLLPVLLATGPGSDVMKPITIPFVFGLITSTLFVLIVLPVLYAMIRERELKKYGILQIREMSNE
jgi:copper/silver efflux system protein